jgi:hypothetical protein
VRPFLTVSFETGFPFCRLIRLAVLRWRYCNPPPYGLVSSVQESSSDTQQEIKRIKEIREIEEQSVEAKTSGIGHGSREVGRKTSSGRVKIKCA